MIDIEFARGQIAKYQAAQAEDRRELARLDAGTRYFSQEPGQTGMVEITQQRRAEKLAHIEMLDGLIRMWQRNLPTSGPYSGSSSPTSTGPR